MPLPFLAAAGISLGAQLISGIAQKTAADKAAKRFNTNPQSYMGDQSQLNALISKGLNRNYGAEAFNLGRGAGFSENTLMQNAAIRGAGRNAFGTLRQIGQQQGQQNLGDFISRTAPGLRAQGDSAVAQLLGLRTQNQQFGQRMGLDALKARTGIEAAGNRALWGPVSNLAGTFAGNAIGNYFGNPNWSGSVSGAGAGGGAVSYNPLWPERTEANPE